jgi:hypothetical protein
MNRLTKSCLLPFSVVLLMATEPSWTSKPSAQWTIGDAKQVLSNSPWVKKATVQLLPKRNEGSRREGGLMGGGQGTGFEGFSLASALTGVGHSSQSKTSSHKTPPLMVRWESAAPVRTAESKADETDIPDWEGDYYVVAIYNVPSPAGEATNKTELKRTASLERDGKKEMKPVRVELEPSGNNFVTVVYYFPRSEEISQEDKTVDLVAQIGRLLVSQSFHTGEMRFQGKLEL